MSQHPKPVLISWNKLTLLQINLNLSPCHFERRQINDVAEFTAAIQTLMSPSFLAAFNKFIKELSDGNM